MGSWSGKKVLVTGAGGFIGSHLAERLAEEGARVRALVHYNALGTWGWLDHTPASSQMEVFAGDVTDRDSVCRACAGQETVFHLAALIAIPYSYHAPESYVRTNIIGTLNVLQAARELGVKRIVHTSTSEVYGTARQAPIPESHPLQGQSPYSASKIGADKIAEAFHLSFGVPVVTVRPFNTFGPRQSADARSEFRLEHGGRFPGGRARPGGDRPDDQPRLRAGDQCRRSGAAYRQTHGQRAYYSLRLAASSPEGQRGRKTCGRQRACSRAAGLDAGGQP